jgi:hypothetical protein
MTDEIKTETPVQPELTPVEKAEKTLKALNDSIVSAEAKIKQYQEIEARRILGGSANAGIQPTAQKEESASEYAKRVASGKL